jgi:aspartyl/asparaginyl beta-hydroxylase (cupin superfamily)
MFTPRDFKFTNSIDETARSIWAWAEDTGRIKKYPGLVVDYKQEFPEFQILEDNWEVIKAEAENLLLKKASIPRLFDLVEPERAKSKVYKADWKVFWLKMGLDIKENQARAPKTTELLKKIPTLTNAFFSVIEPGTTVDPHWGHWGGFLRYHLGLIVPNNNADEDIYLRIRPDVKKDNNMRLNERNALLEKGDKYYWKEGEGVMFDDNPYVLVAGF